MEGEFERWDEGEVLSMNYLGHTTPTTNGPGHE